MKKVSIIGGGITGLVTGLALKKQGIDCEIHEKAKAIHEVGAGIMLQPNAMKILDFLNLGRKVRAAGQELGALEISNSDFKPFRGSGKQRKNEKQESTFVSIHRARLQQVLIDAFPAEKLHLNSAYQSHQYSQEKIKVLTNQKPFDTDVLIGADGIHSKVRTQLFPSSELRYSGQTCWRGIATIELPFKFKQRGTESWGRKARFGFIPISSKEVYWFAVANAPKGEKEDPEERKQNLVNKYDSFNPLAQEIIKHTTSSSIIRNDMFDLKRLKSWSHKHIILLGDAAHAATPNMGQGACQGIEDAYYLSRYLMQTEKPTQAFKIFTQARRKKVDYVVNNSWMFGKMAHHPAGKILMKSIMALTPEKLLQNQLNKLYHIEGL